MAEAVKEVSAPPAIDIARTVLELDCAFEPQAKRLILGSKAHSHKQLVTSTYLYARGVLLADRADADKFHSLADASRRKEYIRWRHQLLASKWERRIDMVERTEDMSFPSMPTNMSEARGSRIHSMTHSRQPSGASHGSRTFDNHDTDASLSLGDLDGDLAADFSLTDTYKFGRAYHLFTEHTKAVPTVRFANQNKDLLCFASLDGGLTLTTAVSHPSVIRRLKDHTRAVTDFDWSMSNEWVISSGLDCSMRLWDVSAGKCLRILYDDDPVTCCRFHPVNNNAVIGGTAKNKLKVFNVSTGKCIQRVSIQATPTSLCFEPNGGFLYVGDAKGNIYVFECNVSGELKQLSRTAVVDNRPITSVDFSRWQGKVNSPSLLVSACDNVLRLLSVNERNGDISLKQQVSVAQKQSSVRSQFCPLVAHKARGVCVVSGSEDNVVQVLDVASTSRPVVARLMGHTAPVLGVSWAYDESILASSDANGIVMLWRREQDD